MRKIDRILDKAQEYNLLPLESRAHQQQASAFVRQIFSSDDLQEMVAFLAHAIVEGTLTLEDLNDQ